MIFISLAKRERLMDVMRVNIGGTQNLTSKTGLFFLGWLLVVVALSHVMQVNIERRICVFQTAAVNCETQLAGQRNRN